jgi:hypothetical protein
LASYLKPKDFAAITSDIPVTPEDYILRLGYYKATNGLFGNICFNDLKNCPLNTDLDPSVITQKWVTTDVLMPKGTKKVCINTHLQSNICQVILSAENKGPHQGAMAVDRFQLFKVPPPGGQATQSLCSRR